MRPRPLDLDGTHRRLSQAYDLADLRRIAMRRTPRSIFDYVDGSAEREISIRRARRTLGGIEFHPSVLHDVKDVDVTTERPASFATDSWGGGRVLWNLVTRSETAIGFPNNSLFGIAATAQLCSIATRRRSPIISQNSARGAQSSGQ